MYDDIAAIVGVLALLYASYPDIRTRHIPPWVWWPVGITGIVLYGIRAYQSNPALLLMLVPLTGILIEALVERGDVLNLKTGETDIRFLSLYIVSALAFIYCFLYFSSDVLFQAGAMAVLISILYFFMYYRDIIHGGADAKALVMLSLLFPFYPHIAGFPVWDAPYPVSMLLPFSFSVLFMASLMLSLTPIYFLFMNLAKGNRQFPEMMLGYRMSIEEAEKRKVWPMVRVVDEEVKRTLFPRKTHEVSWDALRSAGLTEVWVTPKVPFVACILLGFLFVLILGNPLFAVF